MISEAYGLILLTLNEEIINKVFGIKDVADNSRRNYYGYGSTTQYDIYER